MLCHHLQPVELLLTERGAHEVWRGQAWSHRCREWLYVDVDVDHAALAAELDLDPCVVEHINDDARSGTEKGVVCTLHDDAVMGPRTLADARPTT